MARSLTQRAVRDDVQPVRFDADDRSIRVGQQFEVAQPEVEENLTTGTQIAQGVGVSEHNRDVCRLKILLEITPTLIQD